MIADAFNLAFRELRARMVGTACVRGSPGYALSAPWTAAIVSNVTNKTM